MRKIMLVLAVLGTLLTTGCVDSTGPLRDKLRQQDTQLHDLRKGATEAFALQKDIAHVKKAIKKTQADIDHLQGKR